MLFIRDVFDAGGVSSPHLYAAARSPLAKRGAGSLSHRLILLSIGVSVLMDSSSIEVCRGATDDCRAAVSFDIPELVRVYDGSSSRGCRKFYEARSSGMRKQYRCEMLASRWNVR